MVVRGSASRSAIWSSVNRRSTRIVRAFSRRYVGCATNTCSRSLGRGLSGARRERRALSRDAPLLASGGAMADVQPLRALHYDPAVVGPLADVVAPPYDVIDAGQGAELLSRPPFNVVPVDLPQGEPDPYEAAGELFDSWQLRG